MKAEQTHLISSQLDCLEETLMVAEMPCSHLLLHLLNLPDRAAALGAILVPQEIDVQVAGFAVLFLLLLFGVL